MYRFLLSDSRGGIVLLCGNDLFDGLFELDAVDLHGVRALHTADADVTSDANDRKAGRAAGVGLFQLERIVNAESNNLHR